MKTKHSLLKLVISAFYLIFILLGAIVAFRTFHHYQVIVNGTLGIVVFYLIYQVFLKVDHDRVNMNNDMLFEFPKNFKYFFFAFFWTLVMYWAFGRTMEMILSLKK